MKILHHIFPTSDRGTLNADWDYSLLAERPIPRKSANETSKAEQEVSNIDTTSKVPESKPEMNAGKRTAVDGGCRCVVM